jgi:hypothetical protein
MLTLALALKRLAQGFRTADGRRLSLGVGVAAGDPFSKVLYTVTSYRKYTRALTFENLWRPHAGEDYRRV